MALLTCQLRSGLYEITDNSGFSSASRTTTSTSGRTFTLAEIREISLVHPQDGRHPNSGQPVPLAESNEMVLYICLFGLF